MVRCNKLSGLSNIYHKYVATFGLKSDVLNFNTVFPYYHGWYTLILVTGSLFNYTFQFDVGWGTEERALLTEYMLVHCCVPGPVVRYRKQTSKKWAVLREFGV